MNFKQWLEGAGDQSAGVGSKEDYDQGLHRVALGNVKPTVPIKTSRLGQKIEKKFRGKSA
jgi:hypothetical protein